MRFLSVDGAGFLAPMAAPVMLVFAAMALMLGVMALVGFGVMRLVLHPVRRLQPQRVRSHGGAMRAYRD